MTLPHNEVKFYPEVKSKTDLSLLQVSCKRALSVFYIDVNDKQLQASAYEKQGRATISRLSSKFSGYRRVKSRTLPTK